MEEDIITCENILKDWGIPDSVICRFKENSIGLQQLKDLNDDYLKELCPAIGIRINLKQKIIEYATAQTSTVTNSSITDIEKDYSADPADTNVENVSISDIYIPTPKFPDFELKTLLTTSPCGNSILKFYDVNKYLTNKHRAQLTDIIIRHIFTFVVNHRISYEQYNILTSKIISTFPKENASIYFVSPVKKRNSLNGKPSYARGKLVDKVKNILYKSGERKRSLSITGETSLVKKIKQREELKEKASDKITWLKLNNEPWDQVVDYWRLTYELRKDATYDTVTDLINDWPILCDPRGEVLINLDFEELYPNKNINLYQNWQAFIEKIIKTRSAGVKDETTLSLISECSTNEDNDHIIFAQIKLLCHLIPPKGRLNKKIKFSILECLEGIIVEIQNPGDVQAKIDKIASKARENNQTVQPYLLYCNKDEASENKIYLIIDKIRYSFSSPRKAVDTLFKCYQTFHASYPLASNHIYLLIQRCVYGIHTKFDKVVPYIADLLTL